MPYTCTCTAIPLAVVITHVKITLVYSNDIILMSYWAHNFPFHVRFKCLRMYICVSVHYHVVIAVFM